MKHPHYFSIMAAAALSLAVASGVALADEPTQAKGYLIAEIDVTNPEAYQEYLRLVSPMVPKYEGRYIIRAGPAEILEGAPLAGRLAVLEFPSYGKAKEFFDAQEYRAILHHRTDNATSRVILIEGHAP